MRLLPASSLETAGVAGSSRDQPDPAVARLQRPRSLDAIGVVAGGATIAGALAVLGTYLGLLASGHWYIDEFIVFAGYRDGGWLSLWDRIVSWSPRPISEPLFMLYARFVAVADNPLVRWMLGTLWLGFLLSALATARWRRPGLVWRLAAGLSLLAILVASRQPGQVFYWPAGAVAYLPACAALTCALFLLADGRAATRAGNRWLTAALVLAAWSCETGAIFGACFAGLCLVDQGVNRPSQPRSERFLAGSAVVLAASLLVLMLMALHRGSLAGEMPDGSAKLMHHPVASFVRALQALPFDLLTASGTLGWSDATWGDLGHGILVRVALMAGFAVCWMLSGLGRPSRRRLVIFCLAGLATGWLALAASEYQFGQACCARHASFREVAFLLGLAALAIALPRDLLAAPTRLTLSVTAAGLLLAAMFAAVGPLVPGLRQDYAMRPRVRAITAANWASGRSPGPAMAYRQYPQQSIMVSFLVPAGSYTFGPEAPWYARAIMSYFHKQSLTILPP